LSDGPPRIVLLERTLSEVPDRDAEATSTALVTARISPDSSSYEIRSALSVTNAIALLLERVFRDARQIAGSPEATRWLLIGLLQRRPATPSPPLLVWTAPGASSGARNIESVIREHIRRAKKTVTVVGYAVTQAADPLLADLADAVRRAVQVTIVVDRIADRIPSLLAGWPRDVKAPALWTRDADPLDEMSALHAKVMIFDDSYLLVSSANLTFHGLRGNLELGVLLHGDVALEMKAILQGWIKDGLIRIVHIPW
jgi:phosphatidylserine/phosphatidylglycerophosphate/cardiolipin synthase-like enzyme